MTRCGEARFGLQAGISAGRVLTKMRRIAVCGCNSTVVNIIHRGAFAEGYWALRSKMRYASIFADKWEEIINV